MRYRYDKGDYVLFDDRVSSKPSVEARIKEIGILYSITPQGTVVHAHGSADFIQHRHDDLQRQYKASLNLALEDKRPERVASMEAKSASVHVLRSRTIAVSDLNQCIESPQHLTRWLAQQNEQQLAVGV